MPKGLSSAIKTELDATTFAAPIYCVRITQKAGVLRWADRTITFNDGTPAQTYNARLRYISGLDFSTGEPGAVTLDVANLDDAVTTLDRAESFAGAKCEILEYLPGIDTYYIRWSGWCDEITELDAEKATIRAYPVSTVHNSQIPKRVISLSCPWEFGNTAMWTDPSNETTGSPDLTKFIKNFDGSECPYQRVSTVGFTGTLQTNINNTDDPATFTVRWAAGDVSAGAKFKKNDEIKIDSEILRITNSPSDPDINGDQSLTCSRAERGTTIASHTSTATVLYANCLFSTDACTRRGMYGNNPNDTWDTNKERNYFGGFPFITGFQHGRFRMAQGERAKWTRIQFSGNESVYGYALALPYGRVRISDPILLVAKPEGDFLTTLWAVCEGLLATNATDDDQTTPANAYVGGENGLYVNGVTRHDPQPGFGIQIHNGRMDQPEPSTAFFPTSPTDFVTNHLDFIGTAYACHRINIKNNPSVDVSGQSITGAMDIAFGRVVRVYTTTSAYTRKATTNPAWVLLDLMTHKRAGGGLDHSRINLQSFIDVADYGAVDITSTFDGSTVDRWTFNGTIDHRRSYAEWVRFVCLGMYCLPPYVDLNGKLKIRALKSETLTGVPIFSSKVATSARNILWDGNRSSLAKIRKESADVPNEVRVNFVDKSDYARVSIVIGDRDAQRELGRKLGDQSNRVITKTIDLPGTTTLDEAARIGTLVLRAGEFADGGLSNNLKVRFRTAYRTSADIEQGDIIEVEDDLLNAALNERYFRVLDIQDETEQVPDGGFLFVRTITASLHDNGIYDDGALTVSKFDRIDPTGPLDKEPPAVTGFGIAEAGAFDANNKPVSRLTVTYTEPSPLENYRSLLLYMSNDDGSGAPSAGDPVGDWRFVGELFASGGVLEVPITGTWMHFAAVSRAMTGHVPDIDTQTAAGANKYPRVAIFVDGITDTLPAPSNLQIFAGGNSVSLKWDAYTGNDLKLFKTFAVYRNTVNDLGTATKIATLDGTLFVDTSVGATTLYYYWVKGVSVLNIEGTAAGPVNATSPTEAGVDTDVPQAPTIGVIRNIGSYNSNEYEFLIGIDKPGGATNWNSVFQTQLQIDDTDNTFANLIFDRTISIVPPLHQPFRVTVPGTYYFRARVSNTIGDSAWSSVLTRTTDFTEGVSAETAILAGPTVSLVVKGASTNLHLGGNEFEVSWEIPASGSYWGYSIYIHDSATLPTATKYYDGIANSKTCALVAGSQQIAVTTSPGWTTNELAGKEILVFHTSRGATPTFDYEGLMVSCVIASNTADTITVNTPIERMTRTISGCGFFIVTPGAGNHFWDKLKFATPAIINEGVLALTDERGSRTRKAVFASGISQVWVWVALYNLHGQGKVTASPPNATFAGIQIAEMGTASVGTGQLVGTAAGNGAVTAIKTNIVNLGDITLQLGTVQTGLLRTAASGARIEIDSTNGLRLFNSGGSVVTQLNAGEVRTAAVFGLAVNSSLQLSSPNTGASLFVRDDSIGGGMILQDAGGTLMDVDGSGNCDVTGAYEIDGNTVVSSTRAFVGSGGMSASLLTGTNNLPDGVLSTNVPLKNAANSFTQDQTTSGSFVVASGQAFKTAAGTGMVVTNASVVEFYISGTKYAQFTNSSSSTLTNLWLMKNGVLTQVGIRATGELFV